MTDSGKQERVYKADFVYVDNALGITVVDDYWPFYPLLQAWWKSELHQIREIVCNAVMIRQRARAGEAASIAPEVWGSDIFRLSDVTYWRI